MATWSAAVFALLASADDAKTAGTSTSATASAASVPVLAADRVYPMCSEVGPAGRPLPLCNASCVSRLESLAAGRVAQWESARFTRERSLVRNQPRPCREAAWRAGSVLRVRQ